MATRALSEIDFRSVQIIISTVRKPYKVAVNRTASNSFSPSLLKIAAGQINARLDLYKTAPKSGKSSAGLPFAVHSASCPYVPSSGPRELGVVGNTKNAITRTISEA